jgi:cytoskeletal protein CcmA (bactofilin family)
MDVAEVWGRFEGDLTARKHLVIHSTGRVSGYIRYGSIRVEEGGELSGEVSTTAGAQATPRQADSPGKGPLSVAAYEPVPSAKDKAKGIPSRA